MSTDVVGGGVLPPDPGGEPFAPRMGIPDGKGWEKDHLAGRREYVGSRRPGCILGGIPLGVMIVGGPLSLPPDIGLPAGLVLGVLLGYWWPAAMWRRGEDGLRRGQVAREFGLAAPGESPSGALPAWRREPGGGEGMLELVWEDEFERPQRPVLVEVDGETAGWMGSSMEPVVLCVGVGERRVRARLGELESQTLAVHVPAGGRLRLCLSTRRRFVPGGRLRRTVWLRVMEFREPGS